MSDMSLRLAVDRIWSSETPLAVFKCAKPDTVNVVFADTIHTKKLIRLKSPDYVGTVNKETGKDKLERVLREAMGSAVP